MKLLRQLKLKCMSLMHGKVSYLVHFSLFLMIGVFGVLDAKSAEVMLKPANFIPEKVYTTPIWNSDFYVESYSGILTPDVIHFQKYELSLENKYCLEKSPNIDVVPYFAIRNYTDGFGQNLQSEVGTKLQVFPGAQVRLAFTMERLNDLKNSFFTPKLGLIYGKFIPWGVSSYLYSEFYGESFAFKPSHLPVGYLTGSGWFKTGFRLLQKNGHNFDPLLGMLRVYSNDNEEVAGRKYQELLIGPQYSLFGNNGNIGLSVFTGTIIKSDYLTPTPNSFWSLFALEVKF